MILSYICRNIKVGDIIPLKGAKKVLLRLGASGQVMLTDRNSITELAINNTTNIMAYEFPIIDGKSPKEMRIKSTSENMSLYIHIQELGGVPSDDYFDE